MKDSLVSHVSIQEFQCDHCDKAFGVKSKLQTHINTIHKKIKRFGCDLCDYQCSQCSNKFGTNQDLTSHIATVHFKKQDFQCDHSHKHGLDALMKEAEKDQMFVSVERCEPNLPEIFFSADQNDQKNFVQVNVFEEIL
jgi:hypothetical protein